MKKLITELIQKSLKKEFKFNFEKEKILSLLETPPSVEMGDFAFPCFPLARELKLAPNEIALKIREGIGTEPPLEFDDIQTKGPYLNFFVNRKNFAVDLIKNVNKQGDKYGSSNIGNGEKALIEHTSINPNASPHVGRVRNALIGDSIVRIFNFLNYKTETHYYVNDVSKQIAMLVLAGADKLKFEDILKTYIKIAEKVKKSKKLEQEIFELLSKFEKGDKEIIKKFNKIVSIAVKGQEKILSKIGIHYDFFDYESTYTKDNEKILEQLEKTGKLIKDSEGRLVLDQKGTSVENQMKAPYFVLTRSNGTALYVLRDISYTLHKKSIAKKNLIVLGEDQKLYFQQLSEALKLLKIEPPSVVHYAFILLTEKGKSKKMSTRRGDVILLEDFLKDAINKAKKEIEKRGTKGNAEKVGIGAVKYTILKNSNNQIIHFNLEDALNFEGNTGPYLLYSYARASSILRKVKESKKTYVIEELEQKEIELVKKISQFREIVVNAYENLAPSLIANYSYELAQIFNEFYHECQVMDSEKQGFRIQLVRAFRQTLKNSLNLLGIETLEVM